MAEERSAGFVVFRKQAGKRLYLLLEHESGRWDFPKGNIERGEIPLEAAERELKEETGISSVRRMQGWENRISYFYRKGGATIYKEVVFYLCEAADGKVTVSSEHKGFGWFVFDEAMAKLKFKNARLTLEKAETFLRMNAEK